MSILNQSPAPNGNGHLMFPVPRGPRPSSTHHLQQHQDACHHQHLLPVALSLPPPASNTLRCLPRPSRSSCRPVPLVVDANGGFPPREEPMLNHRSSADYGAAVKAQGRRRQMRSSAVVGTSMEDVCNQLPHLQLDGGGEEQQHLIRLNQLSHHPTEEEVEPKARESGAGEVEFEPRSSSSSSRSTLGFVHSLMEDDKYFSLTQEYYHATGSHLDRRQQLLFSPDHDQELPSIVTLTVSVSSAVKLESKQMDQIAKKMRKLTGFKNLKMENMVDPSLIAGFVISYGVDDAHVIDLSVKARLAELEARLQSSDQSAGADGRWSFPGMH